MLENFIKHISDASRQYLSVHLLCSRPPLKTHLMNHDDFQINKLRISVIIGKRKLMKIQMILVPLILNVFNFLILDILNFYVPCQSILSSF